MAMNAKDWPNQFGQYEDSNVTHWNKLKFFVENVLFTCCFSIFFFFFLGVFPNNAGGPLLHLCLFLMRCGMSTSRHWITIRGPTMCVESWNNAFYHIVGHNHPSMWHSIQGIQKQHAKDLSVIAQDAIGQRPRQRIKQTLVQMQARLRNLCIDYNAGTKNLDELLRGVAHNIRLNLNWFTNSTTIVYCKIMLLLKAQPPFLANFLSTTFYDLKVKFGYIGESPETFMSKYTQEVWVFWE